MSYPEAMLLTKTHMDIAVNVAAEMRVTAYEGEAIDLECEGFQPLKSITILWKKDSQIVGQLNITSSMRQDSIYEEFANRMKIMNDGSLRIEKSQLTDEGHYECLYGPHQQVRSFQLIVNSKVALLLSDKSMYFSYETGSQHTHPQTKHICLWYNINVLMLPLTF